jgi:hypothetical protein
MTSSVYFSPFSCACFREGGARLEERSLIGGQVTECGQ